MPNPDNGLKIITYKPAPDTIWALALLRCKSRRRSLANHYVIGSTKPRLQQDMGDTSAHMKRDPEFDDDAANAPITNR